MRKSGVRVPHPRKEDQTFLEEVKNVMNAPLVKKAVRMTNSLSEAITPFIEKPTIFNALKAITGIGKTVIEDVEVWSEVYFISDEWVELFSRDFNGTILKVLSRYPFKIMNASEQDTVIKTVNVNGCTAGWSYNTKLNQVERIYFQAQSLELARTEIKKQLWEMYGDKSIVMRSNKRTSTLKDDDRIVFDIDEDFITKPSAAATTNVKKLKRCLEVKVPRSIMLFGPPGTGKSTLARTIVKELGLRSFRIRVEDMGTFDNSSIVEAIDIFEPDAIIIDDFDRVHGQAALLETFEFFQRSVKLVIATVNDKERLDQALLRPERFDELILVDKMDEEVIRTILGPYADDAFEQVKAWPVVFVNEYVKRRKYMDPEEIVDSMNELADRIKKLENYKVDGWMALTHETRKTKKRGKADATFAALVAPRDPGSRK